MTEECRPKRKVQYIVLRVYGRAGCGPPPMQESESRGQCTSFRRLIAGSDLEHYRRALSLVLAKRGR